MWPSLELETYQSIRKAVIAELRAPRMCGDCRGHGMLRPDDDTFAACTNCSGSGRVAISDRQRGLSLKRDESSFRRTWKEVYEFTFQAVAEAESRGRAELARRLA